MGLSPGGSTVSGDGLVVPRGIQFTFIIIHEVAVKGDYPRIMETIKPLLVRCFLAVVGYQTVNVDVGTAVTRALAPR